MAIRYFDGFDDYSFAQFARYWSSKTDPNVGGSFSSGNGRNGGTSFRAFAINNSNMCYLSKTFDAQATWTAGFALKMATLPAATTVVIAFVDAGTTQVDVRLNTDGTLTVSRNGTTLGTTSFVLSATVFYYIEITTVINNVTGSYDLRINGLSKSSGSSLNTRASSNNSANIVNLGAVNTTGGTSPVMDIDDFYVTNDGVFLGDCRVETKLPTGDGATSNFTKSTGATNFGNVDDNPANDDTDYNFTASVGIDLYTYPALSTSAGTVQAVMTLPVLRNDNAGSVTEQSVCRSGGTNFFGTSNVVGSTTYGAYPDIQTTDPNTGLAWTVANVNAAQFGVKKT